MDGGPGFPVYILKVKISNITLVTIGLIRNTLKEFIQLLVIFIGCTRQRMTPVKTAEE